MAKRYIVGLFASCLLSVLLCSSAMADSPGPGWEVFGRTSPTNLPPGGEGVLYMYFYNIGAGVASEAPTVVGVLPPGVEAIGGDQEELNSSAGPEADCAGTSVVTCAPAGSLVPGSGPPTPGSAYPSMIEVPIKVGTDVANVQQPEVQITVSGGEHRG